jgi:hypothetical protein
MVGMSKTEVGDSLGLLLDALGARRFHQPMAPSLPPLQDLRELPGEMAQTGDREQPQRDGIWPSPEHADGLGRRPT